MDAKREELMRLVVALSHACKHDKNVLKDAVLVDSLETCGYKIARLRQQQKAASDLDELPPSGIHKTMKKKLSQQGISGGNKSVEGTSKRRKILSNAEIENNDFNGSCLFPSIQRQQKDKKESLKESTSFLQNSKITDTCNRPTTPTTVSVAVEAKDKADVIHPLKTHQHDDLHHFEALPFKTPHGKRAASPYKQMARASSPDSVDFSASSTSTMVSYCDDMYDDYSVSFGTVRRYNRSASDRAPSHEFMDRTPSDDDSSDESIPFRSIVDDVEQQASISKVVSRHRAHHDAMEFPLESGRVAAMQQTSKFSGIASSTKAVMEVLYGIMEHNESFKWLLDTRNQVRVAKLVEYHLKKRHFSDASFRAGDEEVINELRMHVDNLVLENSKIKTENARLVGSATTDITIEDLKMRLALSEEAVNLQEEFRRGAETMFQSELESKSKLISCLQRDLDIRVTLTQNGAELPEKTESAPHTEISRLQNTVIEKDREICRLHSQLSTKHKLIGEVAKKVAQQLENDSSSKTPANLHLDMDMFLFKSVAEKQEIISELKAALASIEHEVAGLEARLAKKSQENLLFETKFKSMSSRLTDANVNMSRIQTENDRLVMVLKEKQGKMRDLIEFLEGKEKQVMHLEKHLNLCQTQLKHVMTEFKKMQRLHNTKKNFSDHGAAPNLHTQ